MRSSTRLTLAKLTALLCALMLIAAACSSGSDVDTSGSNSDSEESSVTEDSSDTSDGDDEAEVESNDDDAAEPSGEPIKIGVNVETSGPATVTGTAYANAVTLLAEQINAAGGVLGRPLELVILDNETSGEVALLNTQELADEGIVAMVGPGTSPTTMGAIGAIIESGLPTVSMGSAGVIVFDPEADAARPNVFKTAQNGSLMAEGIAEHMTANGISKVGLLYVNNPYGEDGLRSWEALAEDGVVELVQTESFEAADIDMTVQLSNLQSSGAEAIVVWAIPPGAPTVRRNAIENLGLEIPMYHDAGAGAEIYLDLAGDAAEGALIIHPKTLVWDSIDTTDPQHVALQNFGTTYEAAYGEMSGFAGYSWDALNMIVAAIEASGSTEPDDIISSIENLGEFVGVTGTFEITPDNHQGLGDGDLVMLTVEGGQWVLAG